MAFTRNLFNFSASMRKAAALLVSLAFLALAVSCAKPTVESTEPRVTTSDVKGPGESVLTLVHNIPIVHLKGSAAELGRQQGQLLRERIQKYVTGFVLPYVETKGGREMFDMAARLLAEHLGDEERAELDGIAAGSGVKAEDVLLLNTYMDVAAALAGREGQHYPFAGSALGTDMALSKSAIDGPRTPLAGGSFEVEIFNEVERPEPVLFVVHPVAGKPYTRIAMPGRIGAMAGSNLDGLAFYANPVPGPLGLKPTVPFGMLCRRMLATSGSTDTAAAFLVEHAATTSHNVLLADAQDHVWAVECSAERVAIRKNDPAEERVNGRHAVWCASHFVDGGMASQQVAPSVESLNRSQSMEASASRLAVSEGDYLPRKFGQTIVDSSLRRNVVSCVVFEPRTGTINFCSVSDPDFGTFRSLSRAETYGVLAPSVVR